MSTEVGRPQAAEREVAAGSLVSLDRLALERCAEIVEVRTSDAQIHRLMAMGLCAGHQVRMVQRGNPLIVFVLGTRIGLSRELARNIVVRECSEGACQAGPLSDSEQGSEQGSKA